MGKPIVDDKLWALIEPLPLPRKPRRFRYSVRISVSDRRRLGAFSSCSEAAFAGASYPVKPIVVRARAAGFGYATVSKPAYGEVAYPPAVQAAYRLRRFFSRHRRFFFHSCHWGGSKTGPIPTDRARPGSKHHLATGANGTSLAAIVIGANGNDVTQPEPLVAAIPPIAGRRPLQKPQRVYADPGYDRNKYRRLLHANGITTSTARRGQPHGSNLRKIRWIVERTHAWLHACRRLRVRYD
jgi:transposase